MARTTSDRWNTAGLISTRLVAQQRRKRAKRRADQGHDRREEAMIACTECGRAFVPDDEEEDVCHTCQAEAVADLVCGDLADSIDYEDHWDEPEEEDEP